MRRQMRRLNVKVVANARRAQIVEETEGLRVYVNVPATGGRANAALIELLAEFFAVKKNSIRIVNGEKSRRKVIEIT